MSKGTRIVFAVAACIAAVMLLSGCKTEIVSVPGSDELGTVTASGMGTASAAPDQAVMSFGVVRQNDDAQAALDQASEVADKIIAALKGAGVADEDIQTQNVNVFPISDGSGRGQSITGYQASLSVRATIKDLEKLSATIGAATQAGADDVNGPTFTVSEDATYREEAIQDAVDDARRSAEAMANATGKTVGEVLRISATDTFAQPMPFATQDRAAAAGVPIEPGTLDITANVTVVFELD